METVPLIHFQILAEIYNDRGTYFFPRNFQNWSKMRIREDEVLKIPLGAVSDHFLTLTYFFLVFLRAVSALTLGLQILRSNFCDHSRCYGR